MDEAIDYAEALKKLDLAAPKSEIYALMTDLQELSAAPSWPWPER